MSERASAPQTQETCVRGFSMGLVDYFTSSRPRLGAALCLFSTFATLNVATAAEEPSYDVLIRGGMVLDGSGNPAFRADVGIRSGEIVSVERAGESVVAKRTIDASGLYVAPGFIDVHSHADESLISDRIELRRAHNVLSQGITTVVGAPDGDNPVWPLSAELAAYEKHGTAVNIVPMVGHNTVRGQIMGGDYEREATSAEISRMRQMVRQGMVDGAWGLGAGLEYRPGRFSSRREVIELSRVVAEFDGFYYAHMRGAGQLPKWQLPSMVQSVPVDGRMALEETIGIARETGIRVVASHIKAKGRQAWGTAAADVLLADQARAEGLQVYFDQYAYDGHSGSPALVVPKWAFLEPGEVIDGLDDPVFVSRESASRYRENLRRTLADPDRRAIFDHDLEYAIAYNGGADRIIVTGHPEPSLVGKTVAQISETGGRTPGEVLVDFALTGDPGRLQGALLRPRSLHQADVDLYMQQEYTATSTDGIIGTLVGGHPRSFGSFTRKIAYYVREREVITLPFAIRAATGLPAQIIGLPDRGYIRKGQRADIVIFDYDRIEDRATVLEPDRHSQGIEFLLVNGGLAIDSGAFTDALDGVVVRRNRQYR